MTSTLERPGDVGEPIDVRRRLVVVGNGMAGARAVEEILLRARDMFQVTMFGDEPYGNYNRIMLSHVLSGEESDKDIFLNSLSWYAENDITLHAGIRVTRIDRLAKLVFSDDGRITPYDQLIIATGSSSFMPAMEGLRMDDGSLKPGVFAFRTIDDTRGMIEYATRDAPHRAVVIGGGLLGLEAARGLQSLRPDRRRRARRRAPDERPARPAGGRDPAAERGEARHRRAHQGPHHRDPRRREGRGHLASREAADRLRHGRGRRRHPAQRRPRGRAAGSPSSGRSSSTTRCAPRTSDDIYAVGECVQHRGEVYGLVAPLWEQAVVLADHLTGADPDAAYHGSRTATKLKVAGVDVASMGLKGPERDTDEVLVFSEPKRGVYKSSSSATRSSSAPPCWATPRRSPS